ncbi:hypothetical protein NA56DRAFT_650395 [Hyaloscypha hepaticicola]|uniref:Uncharacterized protein n=1 Tax=Hyaloscypha hepaticicola TaxID=2082293 RepID=A0A2J6PMZ8_9HELO|nr:hypothetical protein NA56DRAFT_650395 [Hyaloscypha hepaticicola]
MGIQTDTHLRGQQYSWCSSAFYFGFLVASFPGSIGFVKFPLGKCLSTAVICWSSVVSSVTVRILIISRFLILYYFKRLIYSII